MVNHLCVVLRQRVVLQLFQLVARRQISELLPPVMIQNCTSCLLVMAWPVSNYDCVCRRHWHGTHTDRHLVIAILVDCYVSLGHLGNHHVLHDGAELRWEVWIQLAHWNLTDSRRLADVTHDYLFVGELVVNLSGIRLYYGLALTNWLALLSWVRRLLARCLSILALRLRAGGNLLSLGRIVVENHKRWVNSVWTGCCWILHVVVLMSLPTWVSSLLSALVSHLWLVAGHDDGTWLVANISVEARVASALKTNLIRWLVVHWLLLRLVVILTHIYQRGLCLLHLTILTTWIRTYARRNLVLLVNNLLVDYTLALPFFLGGWLLLQGMGVLGTTELILVVELVGIEMLGRLLVLLDVELMQLVGMRVLRIGIVDLLEVVLLVRVDHVAILEAHVSINFVLV